MKKSNLKKAKQKAWNIFSKYIRIKYSNKDGYVECISCGITKKWNDGMQAGHLIPGRTNSILFDEELVYPQCRICNYKDGEQVRFWYKLKEMHGYKDDKFYEFISRKNIILKRKESDYIEIEEKYEILFNKELEKRGYKNELL